MAAEVTKHCRTCLWLSDGFGDETRGSGWCYSNEDYHDFNDSCPFWTTRRQRIDPTTGKPFAEPLAPPPGKEDR